MLSRFFYRILTYLQVTFTRDQDLAMLYARDFADRYDRQIPTFPLADDVLMLNLLGSLTFVVAVATLVIKRDPETFLDYLTESKLINLVTSRLPLATLQEGHPCSEAVVRYLRQYTPA